jgi:Family of unknown function (DUF6152)
MPMPTRRRLILAALAIGVAPAIAHHGWSSFDQDKPLYLAGTVKAVRWQNPHAELVISVPAGFVLPADIAARKLPTQSQSVDGSGIVRKSVVPPQAGGNWELELAPLSRITAWGIAEPKPGDHVEAIGYALASGDKRLIRVEYLFAKGNIYGLRSGPQ